MPTSGARRNWGDDRALLNDDEARDRLLDAAERCTVYRYYLNRDDLLLRRVDRASARWVELRRPGDAASSIRELVLLPAVSVDNGDPLNLALYAGESAGLTAVLEAGAKPITDVVAGHYKPLFAAWKHDGKVYPDLDAPARCWAGRSWSWSGLHARCTR
ncbi:hypothetical protein ACTWP6_19465 [Mycobacterium sp. 4D054]|uniref:hypothetical protein n=1 Tax=Mycobacterium sp. 4D054 TaxID=3457440 RepID=UPI003FCEE6A3